MTEKTSTGSGRKAVPLSVERLHELARIGLSLKQIAASVGLSSRRLCERLAAEPELRQAIDAGRAESIEVFSTALFLKAMAGNVSAMKWYLQRYGGFGKRSRSGSDSIGETTAFRDYFDSRKLKHEPDS
jgi:hypothetical protein